MYRDDFNQASGTRWERFFYYHIAEICVVGAIILLLMIFFVFKYERFQEVIVLIDSLHNITQINRALEAYTLDHPQHTHFAPGVMLDLPGMVLCPLQEPVVGKLTFLTTPVPYLHAVPVDPFNTYTYQQDIGAATQAVVPQVELTPVILHWIRPHYEWEKKEGRYDEVGWGGFSVGPSLQMPPEYDLSILRRVPYEAIELRGLYFDPSNGMTSVGILYSDTLGHSNTF